jgi:hypothetical protein
MMKPIYSFVPSYRYGSTGASICTIAVYVLHDLMCCHDVYGVALFVHKCMKIADGNNPDEVES